MPSHFTLPGKIYFAVIGPGPAKRLTLPALELLRRADLVVYGHLVPEDVLELIPPHVAVQKLATDLESNGPRTNQQAQRRMTEAAKNGQGVVRLTFGGPSSDQEIHREITSFRHAGIETELLLGPTWANTDTEITRNSLAVDEEQPPASRNFETISLDPPHATDMTAG